MKWQNFEPLFQYLGTLGFSYLLVDLYYWYKDHKNK